MTNITGSSTEPVQWKTSADNVHPLPVIYFGPILYLKRKLLSQLILRKSYHYVIKRALIFSNIVENQYSYGVHVDVLYILQHNVFSLSFSHSLSLSTTDKLKYFCKRSHFMSHHPCTVDYSRPVVYPFRWVWLAPLPKLYGSSNASSCTGLVFSIGQ